MGKFVWEFGDSYEGEYFNDERQGVGIITYANGDCYEVGISVNRATGLTATKRELGNTLVPMVMSTPARSATTRKKASVSRNGPRVPRTKANGCRTRCTARAPSSGHKGTSTRVPTAMDLGKAVAPKSGLQARSTL